MSSSVRMPPPTVKRHENHLGRAADDVEHDVPPLVAGGDVEEHQFVGPFGLVAAGHFDRIAGIAQVEKVGSFDHPAAIDVEAGNDALGEHGHDAGGKAVPDWGSADQRTAPAGRQAFTLNAVAARVNEHADRCRDTV